MKAMTKVARLNIMANDHVISFEPPGLLHYKTYFDLLRKLAIEIIH